jgi:aliphatic nitrilase
MYSLGEQIHVGSWPAFSLYNKVAPALGSVANAAASRSYALEGQTFVIHTSSIISQEMLDRLADTEERRSLLEGGGGHTEIFGPDGSTVAGPLDPSQEGLLFANLDMSLIAVAKMAGDPTGHYSRPDVTRLLLNRQPRLAVQAFSPNETALNMVVPGQVAPSIGQHKQSSGSSVTESTVS